VSDALVMALVLLLLGSGYAAGRVHAEVGYRTGFRMGYRQGHADGARLHPSPRRPDPAPTIHVTEAPLGSESRHNAEGPASVSST
jgi:hypothetical protein